MCGRLMKPASTGVLQTKYNILPADSISIAHLANGNFIKALETIHLNEENQLFFDLFVSLNAGCLTNGKSGNENVERASGGHGT